MFAIKAEVTDPKGSIFVFSEQKTMYGGKQIVEGDSIFIFASENEGGSGLIALGTVVSVSATPRKPGVARQTPRVRVTVQRDALAKRPLGRRELKPYSTWNDDKPETELNFKLYRQATNKSLVSHPRQQRSCVATFSVSAGGLRRHLIAHSDA